MHIKRKLKLTYLAILLVSFIIIIILSNIFMSFSGRHRKNELLNKVGRNHFAYYTKIISLNNELMRIVNRQAIKNPDRIIDEEFIIQLEESIAFSHTGIVLRIQDEIVYSSDYLQERLALENLPTFDSKEVYDGDDSLVALWQQDFYLSDGREGSIFYFIDVENYEHIVRKNGVIVVIFTLIILSAATGIITYFVSKSITNPLKELDKAANEIKKGNLDYRINISCKDEIGEVAGSFEEMRIRLKKSLETQLQYEENRKELISNISHDLKTPITSIKGYIEGIRDGVADTPDKMHKYVNTIHAKANYMDNLINDLFLYSKLDLNKILFKFQSVDIVSYVKDSVEEISFDLDPSTAELRALVPQKSLIVSIDVQQLKRTIMNIVGNSLKYRTDKKLKIDLIVTEAEEKIIIEIKDNGKGISSDSLPYIFDRFYRADVSRETVSGGSGLGLAIAKKIIEEHGGSIWVESEKGLGTSIFFTLRKHNN
jgi:histidine kinase